MARSAKKGPYVQDCLAEKITKVKEGGKRETIKTWSRRSLITPEFVGMTFAVHNGKKFISVFVTENMVGHRLGEFSPTRLFRGHGTKKIAEAAAGAPPAAAEAGKSGNGQAKGKGS